MIGLLSGEQGIMMTIAQAQVNDQLTSTLQAVEGAKVREKMIRSTVKKLTELEQRMRQEEFKSQINIGEKWAKTLGG